jgi:hypothetical protein
VVGCAQHAAGPQHSGRHAGCWKAHDKVAEVPAGYHRAFIIRAVDNPSPTLLVLPLLTMLPRYSALLH